MIRNVFYFCLGAIAASFVTHAGVPLWNYFTRVINWDVATDAVQDVSEVLTREVRLNRLQRKR